MYRMTSVDYETIQIRKKEVKETKEDEKLDPAPPEPEP
jgi:hypothetical protein